MIDFFFLTSGGQLNNIEPAEAEQQRGRHYHRLDGINDTLIKRDGSLCWVLEQKKDVSGKVPEM